MGQTSEMHIAMQDALMSTVRNAEEGEINMLDAFIRLEEERKQLETSLAIIKSFKDDQLENIGREASQYPDGYMGYSVEVRNGGKSYSYKHIPEWQEQNEALKDIEAKYKSALEAKLKGNVHANISEDGEELPLPEISYRKSSIILKQKK